MKKSMKFIIIMLTFALSLTVTQAYVDNSSLLTLTFEEAESLGVAHDRAGTGGRIYLVPEKNRNKLSRLATYGTKTTSKYRVDTYNMLGYKISSTNTTRYNVTVSSYKIEYK